MGDVINLEEARNMIESNPPLKAAADTPINRATVLELTIDELDTQLTFIRERRLRGGQRLSNVHNSAKAAPSYAEYEAAFKRVEDKLRKKLDKLGKDEQSCALELNKLRAMLLDMGGEAVA